MEVMVKTSIRPTTCARPKAALFLAVRGSCVPTATPTQTRAKPRQTAPKPHRASSTELRWDIGQTGIGLRSQRSSDAFRSVVNAACRRIS